MHVDREAQRREEQQSDGPPLDRQVREADEGADDADRATETGETNPDREELEDNERESDHQHRVRDRRIDQRVLNLRAQAEAVEDNVLIGLAPTPPTVSDHFRRGELPLASARLYGLAVELDDDFADGGADRVDRAAGVELARVALVGGESARGRAVPAGGDGAPLELTGDLRT